MIAISAARGGLALLLVRQRRAAIFESMARGKKRRGGGSHHIFRHAERFEHDDIHGAFPPKSVITDIIAFPAGKKQKENGGRPRLFRRFCIHDPFHPTGFRRTGGARESMQTASPNHPCIVISMYRIRKSFLFSARLPASLSTSRSPARSRRCPPAASPDKTAGVRSAGWLTILRNASLPIAPHPIFSCRSRRLPRGFLESFKCTARRRGKPDHAVEFRQNAVQIVRNVIPRVEHMAGVEADAEPFGAFRARR